MTVAIRWGILGTGAIAAAMANTLAAMTDARLEAVGSRHRDSAERFGDAHGVARRLGSYEELLSDPVVQAVYIATTHNLHHELSLAAAAAGKAVLCEKPMAVNAAQAAAMAQEARRSGTFLMEAMWMRFLPFMGMLGGLIDAGEIGELQSVQADLGFRAPFEPAGRLFDPNLAGGALLDMGVYPIHLAWVLLGAPVSFVSTAVVGPTGVDHQIGAVMQHREGALSTVSASLVSNSSGEANVAGSLRRIRLPSRFHEARRIEVLEGDRVTAALDCGFEGSGLRFEVEEVHRCLRLGEIESPVMPTAESVAILELLDAIRAAAGIRYPMDRPLPA